jgi:hypothetical protein
MGYVSQYLSLSSLCIDFVICHCTELVSDKIDKVILLIIKYANNIHKEDGRGVESTGGKGLLDNL